MWVLGAIASAILLGIYDVAKKVALRANAVLVVLFFTTLFSSLIFLPLLLLSWLAPSFAGAWGIFIREANLQEHLWIVAKSVLVLLAWLLGYMGMKHLPITLVGPINASRPVLVLLGAILAFGERLNLYQWIGVLLTLFSLYLLSLTGKREGIDFRRNKWVVCTLGAAVLGALSGLYDKFLLQHLPPLLVQSWYSLYQLLLMTPLLFFLWRQKSGHEPLRWHIALVLVPLLLSLADLFYFYALGDEEAMISVVSMIRRSSVLVSFFAGAYVFGEQNLGGKILDLLLIFVGLIFLCLGSLS